MADPAAPPRRGRPPRLSIEERREAILDAARRLFAASGRGATTVDEVAELAGVQKPSVYRLYASKDVLFQATVEREAARFLAWTEQLYTETTARPLEERIRDRARGVLRYAAREIEGMTLLTRAMHSWPEENLPVGIELRARLIRALATFAHEEAATGGMALGHVADAIASVTFGLTQTVIEMLIEDPSWDADALGALLGELSVAAIMRSDPLAWAAVETSYAPAGQGDHAAPGLRLPTQTG